MKAKKKKKVKNLQKKVGVKYPLEHTRLEPLLIEETLSLNLRYLIFRNIEAKNMERILFNGRGDPTGYEEGS